MITRKQIESYIPVGCACEEEVAFLMDLDYWATVNINDDTCLQLWWSKTNQVYGIDEPYTREAALECLMAPVLDQFQSSTKH